MKTSLLWHFKLTVMKQTLMLVIFWCMVQADQFDDICLTPNYEFARCKSIYFCPLLLEVLATSESSEQKRFLNESVCGWVTPDNPKLCCGTSTSYNVISRVPVIITAQHKTLLPDRTLCGYQDMNKILGGVDTSITEYPWLALLKYVNLFNTTTYGCGGAIINQRYILTAAHCINFNLRWVRLGDWNIDNPKDCTGKRTLVYCNDPQDVEVESVKIHEDYSFNLQTGVLNDIALIRLKHEINYTTFVQPICLPKDDLSEKASVGDDLSMAGWGITDIDSNTNSVVKQKVKLPVVPLSDCRRIFRKHRMKAKPDLSQICAGGEDKKGTCRGDSGGPLMATTEKDGVQFYVEGILSYTKAGTCGTEVPSVFTRVSTFLAWIKSNIEY